MKRDKCKKIVLAALAGCLLFLPIQAAMPQMPVSATAIGQTSDAGDSKLREFDIKPGTLNPAFSPDTLEYTATVESDVTSIEVRAIPRSASGTIASVEGARELKPGVNTIKVTCSAQNYSVSVYTITVTVGDANAGMQQPDPTTQNMPQGTQTNADDGTQDDQQNEPIDPVSDTQKEQSKSKKKKKKKASALVGSIALDGTVTLNAATYKLSNNFTYGSYSQDIPSAFGEGSLQIGSTTYQTLKCEANGVQLVYMENTDGQGSTGFYYYDEVQNTIERFKYTGTGDNFVVFINAARTQLPDGYENTTFTLPSGKEVAAYQNANDPQMQDYYLIYGIHSDGSDGWYFFDKKQETYMRYVQTASPSPLPEEEEGIEPSVSLDKYNLLNEKYTDLKDKMVKVVSVFAIGIVLLIILFTALLMRGKDNDEDEAGSEQKDRRQVSKKLKKTQKQPETISKSSLAAGRMLGGKTVKGDSKKVTKTITAETGRLNTDTPEQIHAQTQQPFEQQPASVRSQSEQPSDRSQLVQKRRELEVSPQVARESERYLQQSRRQVRRSRLEQETEAEMSAPLQRPQTGMAANTEPELSGQASAQEPEQPGHTQALRRGLLQKDSSAGSEDSVRLAAEKMRQSMQRPATKMQPSDPDPMDEWEIEESAAGRKPQKLHKKKRSLIEDDMDIMDLNDL